MKTDFWQHCEAAIGEIFVAPAGMRRWLGAASAAAALGFTSIPAQAQDAFADAKQSLLAGEIEGALLGISTGAVSINAQDEQGFTLLHYAARAGMAGAVQILLDRGADPAIRAKDGTTPAEVAKLPEIRSELTSAAHRKASEVGVGK
jgi:hypothetical protein